MSDQGLVVEGVSVRFGGVLAVDGVDLRAPTGSITGLIGPNGAGKTTTFNVCSGLQRPTRGRVRIDGVDVTGASPSERARRGLGRTFQRMQLFESLSVRDNVALGAEAALPGANPLRQLVPRRTDADFVRAAAASTIDLCGLGNVAGRRTADLSTGQRRLVELARVLAGPFHVLLLDEPSSGLDRGETQRFAGVLSEVVAERGVGMLIVEHDMSLVLSICAHVFVLDFGRLIFDGTPTEVRASDIVRGAYLGSSAVEAGAGSA